MLIIGHRGCDLYTENTMEAFQKAIYIGCDMIELDIQFTKDKQIIVFHDIVCDRLLPIKGLISSKSYNELQLYNIPLLKNVLDKFNDTKLYIEFKNIFNPEFFELTMKLLKKYNNKNIYLASFNYDYFLKLLNYKHIYKIGYITSNNYTNIDRLNEAYFISLYYELVSNKICEYYKKLGLNIYIYTINNKYIFDKIINFNIDGIITDKPYLINIHNF